MHVSWSWLAISLLAVQGRLLFTWNRSSTRLEYFKKYSLSDPTLGVGEREYMQLMIRDLSLKLS